MSTEGARRVMQTTSPDVANQYLRFGWKLIDQHTLPATAEGPPLVEYVLASILTIEDTRAVMVVTDPNAVNDHLQVGWRLIDKYVTTEPPPGRQERMHYVLAWQTEFEPTYPAKRDPVAATNKKTGRKKSR